MKIAKLPYNLFIKIKADNFKVFATFAFLINNQ